MRPVVLVAVLAACTTEGAEAPPAAAARELRVPLDPPRLARRMSLDLRGVLPSVAELDAVEADPTALPALRDAWLEERAAEARMVQLLGERWRTLVDDVTLQVGEVGLTDADEYTYERSVGEEPLRVMARVVAEDRPWSDVVTGDTTMANETLAALWPIDRPAGDGWVESRYADGRPAVGVLATNGLWWRYTTNESNANRGRAAAISRLLLCEDYLERPITVRAADATVPFEDAIRTQPACVSCHSSLDPIAASLFGFWWFEEHQLDEMSWYHAEREPLGETLGVAPAWFGTPIPGLAGLGDAIAADPRFSRCAAETFAAGLWRRPVERADHQAISDFTEVLEAQDLRIKPLLAAITDDAEYQAGGLVDGADDETAARVATARLLGADQLASAVADLTGFVWEDGGTSLMHEDEVGFRLLAAGVDGRSVVNPPRRPGVTWALVVQRLAEAGAAYAVQRDLVDGQAILFTEVTLAEVPGDARFDAELDRLWWRTLATRPTEAEHAELAALWTAVAAAEGPEAAWTDVLTVLLRDPAFVSG